MTAPQPGLAARLGPIGIAAAATGVLILFGVGAVILPAMFAGGPADAKPPVVISEPSVEPIANTAPSAAPTTADPEESPEKDPAKSPAAKAQAGSFDSGQEDRVVQLINSERRKAHCADVRMHGRLRNAARTHSADMAAGDFTAGKGSDGSSPQDRAGAAGYGDFAAEVLAKGGDAGDVVKHWLRDDDRDVLLDCSVRSIGVGAAKRGRTLFWTVDTGRA